MIELVWPWALLLLPLPVLSYWLLPAASSQQAALRVPFFSHLLKITGESASQRAANWAKKLLITLAWIFLVFAIARPQWMGEPVTLPTQGHDIMVSVDISGSMKTKDLQLYGKYMSRLQVLKELLGQFIERRTGDRLGLILFGDHAYLQAPLTADLKTLRALLNEAQIGFAGANTAIGEAIGLAVKRLRTRPVDSRMLVLITDGANTAGEITPEKAAQIAAKEQVRIYTIGIGADRMERQGLLGSIFGGSVNPSADLDEKLLKQIAQLTGGQYFRGKSADDLIGIYDQIDKMEPIEQDQETVRPVMSLYHWPLTITLGITLLMALGQLPWRELWQKYAQQEHSKQQQ